MAETIISRTPRGGTAVEVNGVYLTWSHPVRPGKVNPSCMSVSVSAPTPNISVFLQMPSRAWLTQARAGCAGLHRGQVASSRADGCEALGSASDGQLGMVAKFHDLPLSAPLVLVVALNDQAYQWEVSTSGSLGSGDAQMLIWGEADAIKRPTDLVPYEVSALDISPSPEQYSLQEHGFQLLHPEDAQAMAIASRAFATAVQTLGAHTRGAEENVQLWFHCAEEQEPRFTWCDPSKFVNIGLSAAASTPEIALRAYLRSVGLNKNCTLASVEQSEETAEVLGILAAGAEGLHAVGRRAAARATAATGFPGGLASSVTRTRSYHSWFRAVASSRNAVSFVHADSADLWDLVMQLAGAMGDLAGFGVTQDATRGAVAAVNLWSNTANHPVSDFPLVLFDTSTLSTESYRSCGSEGSQILCLEPTPEMRVYYHGDLPRGSGYLFRSVHLHGKLATPHAGATIFRGSFPGLRMVRSSVEMRFFTV